jgi:hypothetical protein
MFHPLSLAGDAGILLFTAFLGWALIKPDKRRILFTGITALALSAFIFGVRVYYISPRIFSTDTSQALKSLPYLAYVAEEKDIEKSGVVAYNEPLCNKGINIYNSYKLGGAHLMDMSGNILHTWRPEKAHWHWHYVKMYNKSDLLVIIKDIMLMRLDRHSNIKWAKKLHVHHDIAVGENKDIYTLARKDEVVFSHGLPLPVCVRNDYIVILSADGEIKKEIPLFKILKKEVPLGRVFKIYGWIAYPKELSRIIKRRINREPVFEDDTPPDIFHANSIELINRDIGGIFKKGNFLFCSKSLDMIGVIDIKKEKLLWSWGMQNLDRPHHPAFLENGNILIFDNGYDRGYSRIVELNPFTEEIIWEYGTGPSESFFSTWGGANQSLPNGNILITDSAHGRVFEITKGGKIVWEFYNPHRYKNGKRATIYRMMRITDPGEFFLNNGTPCRVVLK